MILSSANYQREVEIENSEPSMVGPASYDVRLGDLFLAYYESDLGVGDISTLQPVEGTKVGYEPQEWRGEEARVIQPQEFILATTVEKFVFPDNVAGTVMGKSSLARQGLMVTAAGFIDPGFRGEITLQLKNLRGKPLLVYFNQPIAQVVFHRVSSPVQYNGRYQDQEGPTAAKEWISL